MLCPCLFPPCLFLIVACNKLSRKTLNVLCSFSETGWAGESNEIAYSAVLQGEDGAEGIGEDIFKKGAENLRAAAGT